MEERLRRQMIASNRVEELDKETLEALVFETIQLSPRFVDLLAVGFVRANKNIPESLFESLINGNYTQEEIDYLSNDIEIWNQSDSYYKISQEDSMKATLQKFLCAGLSLDREAYKMRLFSEALHEYSLTLAHLIMASK